MTRRAPDYIVRLRRERARAWLMNRWVLKRVMADGTRVWVKDWP